MVNNILRTFIRTYKKKSSEYIYVSKDLRKNNILFEESTEHTPRGHIMIIINNSSNDQREYLRKFGFIEIITKIRK